MAGCAFDCARGYSALMQDQLDKLSLIAATGPKREHPVVLHVDDDLASLMMAEGALEDAGFEVIHAANGLEAVEQFHAREPDLIIMDAIMPRMDGFEAISAIRELPLGAHVPILMITGLDDLDSITRAYDEGATDFLTKPVNFFILPHRVQYMLRSKNTADALRSSQAKLDNAQRIALERAAGGGARRSATESENGGKPGSQRL